MLGCTAWRLITWPPSWCIHTPINSPEPLSPLVPLLVNYPSQQGSGYLDAWQHWWVSPLFELRRCGIIKNAQLWAWILSLDMMSERNTFLLHVTGFAFRVTSWLLHDYVHNKIHSTCKEPLRGCQVKSIMSSTVRNILYVTSGTGMFIFLLGGYLGELLYAQLFQSGYANVKPTSNLSQHALFSSYGGRALLSQFQFAPPWWLVRSGFFFFFMIIVHLYTFYKACKSTFSNGLSFSYCSFYSGYKPFRSYKCSRIFPHSQLTFHSLNVLMNRNSYFIAGQIHWSFPSWFVLLTFHLNTVSSATSFSSSFPVLPL